MQADRIVSECEICLGSSFEEVAQQRERGDRIVRGHRIVMCRNCGFFSGSPAISREDLRQFYDDEFDGDPGANERSAGGQIDPAVLEKEELRAKQWAMPVIGRHMDVSGKTFLDLRSRTGGLAALLARNGATVTAADPMAVNAEYLQRRHDINGIYLAPECLDLLPDFEAESFDAVSMLTIHVMAHVVSPRRLISRIYEILKPGGYVFLDEKDIFSPYRIASRNLFAGGGHFHHFTVESTRRILAANGFEVLECDVTARKSDFRHIVAVARKPKDAPAIEVGKADVPAIERKLASVQRKIVWLSAFNQVKRRLKGRRRAG